MFWNLNIVKSITVIFSLYTISSFLTLPSAERNFLLQGIVNVSPDWIAPEAEAVSIASINLATFSSSVATVPTVPHVNSVSVAAPVQVTATEIAPLSVVPSLIAVI